MGLQTATFQTQVTSKGCFHVSLNRMQISHHYFCVGWEHAGRPVRHYHGASTQDDRAPSIQTSGRHNLQFSLGNRKIKQHVKLELHMEASGDSWECPPWSLSWNKSVVMPHIFSTSLQGSLTEGKGTLSSSTSHWIQYLCGASGISTKSFSWNARLQWMFLKRDLHIKTKRKAVLAVTGHLAWVYDRLTPNESCGETFWRGLALKWLLDSLTKPADQNKINKETKK